MAASCNTYALLDFPCVCISRTGTMVKPLMVVEVHLHWYSFEADILLAQRHPDLVIIPPAIVLAVHYQETGPKPIRVRKLKYHQVNTNLYFLPSDLKYPFHFLQVYSCKDQT